MWGSSRVPVPRTLGGLRDEPKERLRVRLLLAID